MANMITDECVNCGACVRMCPGEGISAGPECYVIDQDLCTECVGFYQTQQCARVCPVDACVLDPTRVESEAVLFERAQRLPSARGRTLSLGPETSHYRVGERMPGIAASMGHKLVEVLGGGLKYYLLMFAVVGLALLYAYIADPCNQLVRQEFMDRYPDYRIIDSGADKGSPERVFCHVTYRKPDDPAVYEDVWLYLRIKDRWVFTRAVEQGQAKE